MSERKERRDAEENRRVILQKAKALIETYGMDAVSMHQIAQSAGVGQGTLYRRYANKAELCRDLKDDQFRQFFASIEASLGEMVSQGAPLRSRFIHALEKMVDFVDAQSSWLATLQYQAPLCDGRRMTIYHTDNYAKLHAIFSLLIEEAAAAREDIALHPAMAADVLLSAMFPGIYLFLHNDRKLAKSEILDGLIRMFVDPLFR